MEDSQFVKVIHQEPNFKISEYKRGDLTILSVEGDYTFESQDRLRKLIQHTPGPVALSLSDYNVTSSSFVGVLLVTTHEKKKVGRKLVLIDPPDRLLDLIHLTKTEEEFEIIKSNDDPTPTPPAGT